MRKVLSIALILSAATIAVPAAQADPTLGERIIAQENAKRLVPQTTQTAVQRLVAQERARAGDPALFGPFSTPVQVVGSSDDFDLRDAGVGGAMGLAFALLVAAAMGFRGGRRQAPETASAGS